MGEIFGNRQATQRPRRGTSVVLVWLLALLLVPSGELSGSQSCDMEMGGSPDSHSSHPPSHSSDAGAGAEHDEGPSHAPEHEGCPCYGFCHAEVRLFVVAATVAEAPAVVPQRVEGASSRHRLQNRSRPAYFLPFPTAPPV